MAENKKSIKIDADVKEFKKSITEASNTIKTLNSELKLNQAQLNGSTDNIDLLSNRLDLLSKKYIESSKKIDNINNALKKSEELYGADSREVEILNNKLIRAKIEQQSVANEIDKTNKSILTQTNSFITSGEQLKRFTSTMNSVGGTISKVGDKVSIVSAGIVAGATSAIKSSIDYESAFAGVKKTVDTTTEGLEELRTGIIELSKEMPASATEIAGVAESAGQLGISADNILEFTKVMINLGEATNLSSEKAASSLAKFANITNMSADNYERLGSTIVALGNNYATTEADIVEMATRLASTGEIVGLSQSQILALATTMSSLGIEAEAGGSAMSTLLKKIQIAVETGSDDLKQYAEVANMTAEEFKTAFGNDAVQALSLFISGLNDTERNGKSAIAILNDMGLTEVRLSNTILSLASSNGLMTDAIILANNAWNENTALTNEVEQRYSTTESQLTMLKNEVVALAIELGNELVPALKGGLEVTKPIIKDVANVVKKFSELDDTTKNNIIRFGEFVAISGPVLKVSGNLIQSVGKISEGLGNASDKIGKYIVKLNAKKAAEEVANATASTSVKTLTETANVAVLGTKSISALSVALSGISVVGGTFALYEVASGVRAIIDANDEFVIKNNELMSNLKSMKDTQIELNSEKQNYLNINLSEIANIERLKNELAILVDENGRVKDGYENRVNFILNELNSAFNTEYTLTDGIISKYNELSDTIDNLILKKKANIILDSKEDSYKEAVLNQGEAVKNLVDLQNQLTEAEKEYDEWASHYHESTFNTEKFDRVQELKQAVEDQKGVIQEYTNTIYDYENTASLIANGSAESLKNVCDSVTFSYQERTNNSIESLRTQIEYEKAYISELKTYNQENENEITSNQILEHENRLLELQRSLNAQTSTVAYRNLDFKAAAEFAMQGYIDGIKNKESEAQSSANNISNIVKNSIGNIDSYSKGNSVVTSFASGLRSGVWSIQNAMSFLNSNIQFKGNSNVSVLQLPGHANGLDYVPFDNYVARLHKGERVLTAKENEAYSKIEKKIVNNSTVSTRLYDNNYYERFSSMIKELANRPTKLYIDGKEFAYAIADDKDNVDGIRINLAKRGLIQ